MAMSSREKLLEAGLELFHCYGIYPVGLDRILAHAGVTKTTFYKYFESKEAFVCAVLDVFAEQLLKKFSNGHPGKSDQELQSQLLELFNAWDSLQFDGTFRGCLLLSAGVASGDPNDPARSTAIGHKRRVLEAIQTIADGAGFVSPERFAARFGAILDSSIISRQLYGDQQEASETRRMAEQLITTSLSERDNSK
jgi:AcrR family transcriptional regulator